MYFHSSAEKYSDKCDAIEENIFNNKAVIKIASKWFLCMRVDIDKENEIILGKFKIKKAPYILILDKNGKKIGSSSNAKLKAKAFIRKMKKAVKKNRKTKLKLK